MRLPAFLELREQTVGAADGGGIAGHTLDTAVLPLDHQARSFEDGHVFLHGGKRHVVTSGQLCDRRFGDHHARENVTPRRIGESPEQLIQSLARCRSIYNHLVVDSSTFEPPALDGGMYACAVASP